MKERPIVFPAPMIRAILDGSKTTTRQVVTPQPWPPHLAVDGGRGCVESCLYGVPGDRLWVRETWAVHKPATLTPCKMPLFEYQLKSGVESIDPQYDLLFRATAKIDPDFPVHWRPSTQMPRCLSRITLEVVSVKVERLQDISDEGAQTEGCYYGDFGVFDMVPRMAFSFLWDSAHSKKDSWKNNPWVWVVEFKRAVK